MKMRFIVVGYILLFCILSARCPATRKRKNVAPQEDKVKRYNHLADSKKIENAKPYQRIHTRIHPNDLEAYEKWPELENKTPDELIEYCHIYLLCTGIKNISVKSTPKLDIQYLMYYIIDENITILGDTITRNNYHKTRLVRILKCQVNNRIIHRFVEATNEYSAFSVEPTNTSRNLFTIVGACSTSTLNEIISQKLHVVDEIAIGKKYYHADLRIIYNAAPYAQLHAKMHPDNMDAYKIWPELETKVTQELDIFCCNFLKCMKLKNNELRGGLSKLDTREIKYYIDNKELPYPANDSNQNNFYVNRWVRVLKCHVYGHTVHQFIKGCAGYTVFLIAPTNSSYKLFAIVGACETATVTESNDLIPLSLNKNTETNLQRPLSQEYGSK